MQIAIAVIIRIFSLVSPRREPKTAVVARALERAAAEFYAP